MNNALAALALLDARSSGSRGLLIEAGPLARTAYSLIEFKNK